MDAAQRRCMPHEWRILEQGPEALTDIDLVAPPSFRRSAALGRRRAPRRGARRCRTDARHRGGRSHRPRGRSLSQRTPGAGTLASRRRGGVKETGMEERFDLEAALRSHLGYQSFRPGQEEIVRSVLCGRPTIAVMPTGSGKSLCYQLPAVLLEGTSIVASPLVALTKDQSDALASRGIAATFVNSSLPDTERHDRQERIRRGEFKIVYVAPERFRSASFRACVAGVRVPLFAIDEAHCISSWGHDFRPDYLRLAEARGHLRAERILALTP